MIQDWFMPKDFNLLKQVIKTWVRVIYLWTIYEDALMQPENYHWLCLNSNDIITFICMLLNRRKLEHSSAK